MPENVLDVLAASWSGLLTCARCGSNRSVAFYEVPRGVQARQPGVGPRRVASVRTGEAFEGVALLCGGCHGAAVLRGERFVPAGAGSEGLREAVERVLAACGRPVRRSEVGRGLEELGRYELPERVTCALAGLVRTGRAERVDRGLYQIRR